MPYPKTFTARLIQTNGPSLYVRHGGTAPAVVLLHGFGDSGYTKKNQALDIAGVMDDKAELVTHDIGNMVGYALAAQFPARITKWVVVDAPLPVIAIGTRSFRIR